MRQGREARVCWQTAERLRKPESGTAVRVDVLAVLGLARVMSSKGRETSWEPDPALWRRAVERNVTTL